MMVLVRRMICAAWVLACIACASTIQQAGAGSRAARDADAAYARGEYERAAELYDDAAREQPSQASLRERRTNARRMTLLRLVEAAEQRRPDPEALETVYRVAMKYKLWFGRSDGEQLDEPLQARVDALVRWMVDRMSGNFEQALGASMPLLATERLRGAREQLSTLGFAHLSARLESEARTAGAARCNELSSQVTPEQPHVRAWVACYCRAFAAETPGVGPTAEQVGRLRIDYNALERTTQEQRAVVDQRIQEVFRRTPWFHPEAQREASARVDGIHSSPLYSSNDVTRETQWHDASRNERRAFSYAVKEQHARYDAAWDITIDLSRPAGPITVELRSHQVQSADEHDVTFEPAGVRPQRAAFMTEREWFDKQLDAATAKLAEQAQTLWYESFCSSAEPSLESASRCAFGAPGEVPQQLAALLQTFARDDVELVSCGGRP
jgi:hypothetical protein